MDDGRRRTSPPRGGSHRGGGTLPKLVRLAIVLAAFVVPFGSRGGSASGRATIAGAAGSSFSLVIDRQDALFSLSGLTPGPIGARCILIEVRDGRADEVVLSADIGGTGLEAFLDVEIDAGTATDSATCGEFVGVAAFSGTLEELGRSHGDPVDGIRVPLIDQTRVMLRFTLTLRDDNRAQGAVATARFGFDARDVSPDVPTGPGTTTAPEPTAATEPGTTTAPSSTAPETTTPATTTPDAGVVQTTGAAVPPPPPTTGPAGPTEQPVPVVTLDAPEPNLSTVEELLEAAASASRKLVEVTGAAASVSARTAAAPGLFSVFAMGFLLLQARVDRRDPKLAVAPITPEPDLEFRRRHVPRRPGDSS